MTNIHAKFCTSKADTTSGKIIVSISSGRRSATLPTGLTVAPDEWHRDTERIVVPAAESQQHTHLRTAAARLRAIMQRLGRIDAMLERRDLPYSPRDIADIYTSYCRNYTLFAHMERIIADKLANGRTRTAETYRATLNSFRNFRRGADIMIDTITSATMEDYQTWLAARGAIPNTTSFYCRILRAAYRRALDEQPDMIDNRHPFRKVYTGVERTVKRALPLSLLQTIASLNLADKPHLDYARDMFLLSFYFRGMSFIDMSYLRKSDLRNGHIVYRRRKTGQQLTIGWTPHMQRILDKYQPNASPFLLPIITGCDTANAGDCRRTYRNRSYTINRNLKTIARMAGIDAPLSLYVARHSWATAARDNGIPMATISDALGHESETTTRIYLASLDTTAAVDRANARILDALAPN